MKKLLLFIPVFFLFLLTANATDYYIAANGNDYNSGTSQSSPWQSLDKLNAYFSNIRPGDRVLLRRGDTFYGSIKVGQNGTAGSPITIGAYGSGDKPVVTGFTDVNSWNNLGGNIWESSTAVSTLSTLKIVVVNGVNTPMGRYPNGATTYPFLPNFFTFQSRSGSGVGNSSITSSNLDGGNNWTGADVVIRVNSWSYDRETITSQNGNTLNYVGKVDGLKPNWGFFIQNDPKTLDVQNEWYYNPSTKKIRIYSTYYPTNVQVSTVENLYFSPRNYITVDNLDFKGANTNGIHSSSNKNATFTNCTISFAGEDGMFVSNSSSFVTIDNCIITDCGHSAIMSYDSGPNYTIKNSTIKRSGLVSVYKANNYSGGAISLEGPNTIVQYNSIDSSAYVGIAFGGSNTQIRNNFINYSTLVRDDGGGIYTGHNNRPGRVIDGNIVMNTIGNRNGKTPSGDAAGYGIMIDDFGTDIKITNNTVANCVKAGIFLHDTKNVTVDNNNLYNNGSSVWGNSQFFVQSDAGEFTGYVRGNTVTNNIFFAKNSGHYALEYYFDPNGDNDLSKFGTIESNYYAKPISPSTAILYQQGNKMNLSQWQSSFGKDSKSKEAPKTITDVNELRFEYNATQQSKTNSLDANYIDVKGNSYNGSITLQPYTSVVLIRSGALQNLPPTANAGSDQTITLPTNSVELNGGESTKGAKGGEGGKTLAYKWIKKSGPTSGKIIDPNSSSTGATDLVEGVYVFELTVTNESGSTATATVQITVEPSVSGTLLPALNLSNLVNGIDYKYYEGSSFSVVPDFSKLTSVKTGNINNFDISVANRQDKFAFSFDGYIDVPTDGLYTFYTTSDDGSMLYIDNQLVVNNNGLHGAVEKSGQIGLKAGNHAISVGFFEQEGDQILNVNYAGPGISKKSIPNTILFRSSQDAGLLPSINPANTVNGLDYSYYEGSYSLMPDLSKLTSVKTGTNANFDLSIANRAEYYAINFTGYIDVPVDGYYTFYTASDDGSMLYIDNVEVVNNDGLHGSQEKSGDIGLKAGKHAISVGFFQGAGDKMLSVNYMGPNISKRTIPAASLYRISSSGDLLPAVNPIDIVNGLDYKYLEGSNYTSMPSFSGINPTKTGESNNFNLSVANRSEYYAINFTGYIDVPSDGHYTFYSASDDGSMLYIDNVLVADNNGLHGWVEKSGTIGLKAGKHLISVEFFQASGDKSLQISYEGPGIPHIVIPSSVLYRDQSASARFGSGFGGEALASTNPIKDQSFPNSIDIAIKAYPNPFVNSIEVTLNGDAGDFKLQMLDAVGRTLWTRTGSKNKGYYKQSVNTSSLQKGIYFLRVIQNEKSSVIKLLK